MKETTLCYIEQNNKYLMLHKNKNKDDMNYDKWLGVGGKLKANETVEECLLREVYEETGYHLTSYSYRGIVTFVSDTWDDEIMHLYTADGFSGDMIECDEGTLKWVDKSSVLSLNLWEGDAKIFEALENHMDFFELELHYVGETLSEYIFK